MDINFKYIYPELLGVELDAFVTAFNPVNYEKVATNKLTKGGWKGPIEALRQKTLSKRGYQKKYQKTINKRGGVLFFDHEVVHHKVDFVEGWGEKIIAVGNIQAFGDKNKGPGTDEAPKEAYDFVRQHGKDITKHWCEGVTRILKDVWPAGTDELTVDGDIAENVKKATKIWKKGNVEKTAKNLAKSLEGEAKAEVAKDVSSENENFQTRIKDLIVGTMANIKQKLEVFGDDTATGYFKKMEPRLETIQASDLKNEKKSKDVGDQILAKILADFGTGTLRVDKVYNVFGSVWKLTTFGGFIYPLKGPYKFVETEKLKKKVDGIKVVSERQLRSMADLVYNAIPSGGFLFLVESANFEKKMEWVEGDKKHVLHSRCINAKHKKRTEEEIASGKKHKLEDIGDFGDYYSVHWKDTDFDENMKVNMYPEMDSEKGGEYCVFTINGVNIASVHFDSHGLSVADMQKKLKTMRRGVVGVHPPVKYVLGDTNSAEDKIPDVNLDEDGKSVRGLEKNTPNIREVFWSKVSADNLFDEVILSSSKMKKQRHKYNMFLNAQVNKHDMLTGEGDGTVFIELKGNVRPILDEFEILAPPKEQDPINTDAAAVTSIGGRRKRKRTRRKKKKRTKKGKKARRKRKTRAKTKGKRKRTRKMRTRRRRRR